MTRAANHEAIVFDWSHDIEAKGYIGFSDQTGKEYIRMSSYQIYPDQIEGWLFHPFNPWRKRFDAFTQTLFDFGLVKELKNRALGQMKTEAQVEFEPPKNDSFNHVMTLNEFLGIFLLLIVSLVVATLAFTVESRHQVVYEKIRRFKIKHFA